MEQPGNEGYSATEYLKMQAPYQHRILVCDRYDCAVMEMVNGKLIYPTSAELEAFMQDEIKQEQIGGITMT